MDLVTHIEYHARTRPDKLAIVSPQEILTYKRLLRIINNITEKAATAGLQPGDMITVSTSDFYQGLLMLLGLSRLGIAALSVSPGYNPATLNLPFKAMFTNREGDRRNIDHVILYDQDWLTPGRLELNAAMLPGHKDDMSTSLLAMTSGTTGMQKVTGMTLKQVKTRIWNIPGNAGYMGRTQIRDMTTLGLATAMGQLYTLRILWSGGTLFIPFHKVDPAGYLRSINLYNIDQMFVPTRQIHSLTAQQKKINGTCPSLKTIITGGSSVSPRLVKEARQYLCENIIIMYGCSEAGSIAYAPSHLIEHIPGAAGFIVPWVKIETVDESGKVLPAGEEGILRIYSPENQAINSYLNNPDNISDIFSDGWFCPGDTGYVTEDNILVITGRISEVLNLGGNKIAPEKIEEILIKNKRIRDVAVFGFKNEYGIEKVCAAVVRTGTVPAETLLEMCKKNRLTSDITKIVFVDEIPRNDMGKVMRQDLRSLVNP